jgi:hypothetical protein
MPQRVLFPLCFAVQLGAAVHADCVPVALPERAPPSVSPRTGAPPLARPRARRIASRGSDGELGAAIAPDPGTSIRRER